MFDFDDAATISLAQFLQDLEILILQLALPAPARGGLDLFLCLFLRGFLGELQIAAALYFFEVEILQRRGQREMHVPPVFWGYICRGWW